MSNAPQAEGGAILWYRRDLRLHDHPALASALRGGQPVTGLFVLDDRLLNALTASPNRNWFLLETLRELQQQWANLGGTLAILHGRPEVVVPAFAAELKAKDVYVSRDYTPFARRRDAAVAAALQSAGVGFHAKPGTLIAEPEQVISPAGTPYSVYTPFRRRWGEVTPRNPLPPPAAITSHATTSGEVPPSPTPAPHCITPGETAARARLIRWIGGGISTYADSRDILDGEATSRLSQDLKWGTLSPVEILSLAVTRPGSEKYVNEVAWREFYYHVLWHNPHITTAPFQSRYTGLQFENNPSAYEAWEDGKTGYPVVDAAMRELLATGYMHNRGRMIVASFLTKDLLLDWRLGVAHFMRHLVDGDIANNVGGWQWAASVGTDAQPYFRIFNPYLQSKKFDPEGAYIRRWVPELAAVPTRYIHEPHTMPPAEQQRANCVIGHDYPAPIVDHSEARNRALALFAPEEKT